MSKAKHLHSTDSEVDGEPDTDEVPAQKKRRIPEAVGIDLQLEFPEVEKEDPGLDFGSTSVDQEDADLGSLEAEEGKNFSQNKNPSLWCVAATPGSSDSFWDVSSSKSYDHAVDDPLFWGPYLSERQWGTVREDYSEDDNW